MFKMGLFAYLLRSPFGMLRLLRFQTLADAAPASWQVKGDGLSFGKNKEDTYGLALDCGPYGENCSDKCETYISKGGDGSGPKCNVSDMVSMK